MMEEDIMNLDWQGAADYVEPRVGSRQVLISDLREAQKLICLRLTTKFDTVREALRFIDTDGSGVIDREEIKEMLFRFNILAPRGEPAHAANGEYRVTEDVLDTFVEVCQGLSLNSGDGDTRVECDEFTEVIMAEDVMGLGDWEGGLRQMHQQQQQMQMQQQMQQMQMQPPPQQQQQQQRQQQQQQQRQPQMQMQQQQQQRQPQMQQQMQQQRQPQMQQQRY